MGRIQMKVACRYHPSSTSSIRWPARTFCSGLEKSSSVGSKIVQAMLHLGDFGDCFVPKGDDLETRWILTWDYFAAWQKNWHDEVFRHSPSIQPDIEYGSTGQTVPTRSHKEWRGPYVVERILPEAKWNLEAQAGTS